MSENTSSARRGAREQRGLVGVERAGYLALHADDPVAAARFAADHLGLAHVHTDAAGRTYLAAHGPDPYSLVYSPGPHGKVDHLSYLVRDRAALERAADALEAAGAAVERIARSQLWRGQPAVRVQSPAGHTVQLTVGVHTPVPVAAQTASPDAAIAPLALDHIAPLVADPDAEVAWGVEVLGLSESARVVAPEVGPVVAFLRGRPLFHCYTVVRGAQNGLHHFQFSFKDGAAVRAAAEALTADADVEVLWGPVRHGPGHTVALYLRDYTGNIVEFSSEEEVVLDDDAYEPRTWSAQDPTVLDEWGSLPPEGFL